MFQHAPTHSFSNAGSRCLWFTFGLPLVYLWFTFGLPLVYLWLPLSSKDAWHLVSPNLCSSLATWFPLWRSLPGGHGGAEGHRGAPAPKRRGVSEQRLWHGRPRGVPQGALEPRGPHMVSLEASVCSRMCPSVLWVWP